MNEVVSFLVGAFVIGIGATSVMDLWAILLKRCLGIPPFNYDMVGRWIGHFRNGQFIQENISETPPVRGERTLGWLTHYAIGIAYAASLLAIAGLDWAQQPSLLPALLFGLGSVAAPFFIMQPGLGAGVAASKTPNPNTARLRSLMAHAVFGFGLYASAWLWAAGNRI